ncbi:MAG: ComEC/Rec2 family competence protein [Dysgonamonadaceae bacterium]|nr:ComEC/Rec2 family competence protein [Dysgonamonadaceae bacterium]
MRLVLFVISGIVVQSQKPCSSGLLVVLLLFSLLFFVGAYLPKFKKNYPFRFLFGAGLALLLFVAAAFFTRLAWREAEWPVGAKTHFYKAQIVDEPVRRPKTWRCDLRILSAGNSIFTSVKNKQIRLYLPHDNRSQMLRAGDCITFSGTLNASEEYLHKQSLAATGFLRAGDWQLIPEFKAPFSIRIKALQVRRQLLSRLRRIIPGEDSFALAEALVFGYRNDLDEDLQQSFRNIGAAHILAISGAHFAILFGIGYGLLSFLGNYPRSKRLKQAILLPLMWIFAFLTGFSPSVVRAVLMLTVWGIGEALGRRTLTLNTVAATGFMMLVFNPLYLFDLGFQLSFAAVISILLLNPYFVRLYQSKNLIIKYIWDLSCVSVSAQIGVLPLSIYYFHQFPVFFLLSNILLLPLVSVILFLVPFSMLFDYLSVNYTWVMWPLRQSLAAFISIARRLDNLPYGSIQNLNWNLINVVAALGVILLLALLFVRKRMIYACLLLILLGALLVFTS